MQLDTTHTENCFLCGSPKNLTQIRRWKPLGRAVKLVKDFICSKCEKKINKEKKFKFNHNG